MAVDAGRFEVTVVGGGMAGWVAATSAQELGRSVVVVERSEQRPSWSNSVISGGVLHAALQDPRTPSNELLETITRLTGGHASPAVAQAWAANAARAVEWVKTHGGRLVRDSDQSHRAVVFSPVRQTIPGLAYKGSGTATFLSALAAGFLTRRGKLLQPARATRLDRGAGDWRVTVESPSGLRVVSSRAVVLADGGFQANPALLRRYLGTDQVKLRATDSSVGDGLAMGLAAGGVTVNMDGFYGHLLVREALKNDDLWPYPLLDGLASAGILFGRDGCSLAAPSLSGVTAANRVARSSTPLDNWIVVDDTTWNREGRAGVTPPNPYLQERGGTVLTALTLPEVALRMGLDPACIDAVAAQASRGGHDQIQPLGRGPFHAIPVVAGVTFTLGGLQVDGRARVLTEAGSSIPGLYAAGGTMGGLHGGPDAGYGGGLLEAVVFGLLAGTDAARLDRAETGA